MVLLISVFTACDNVLNYLTVVDKETKDNNEISEKIIDGIFSKDVEKIKNLFSKGYVTTNS